ncbi:MAG: sigma-70 family RNA polymerase sigma factor [Candidatus Ozemobacteraceae bacterium]
MTSDLSVLTDAELVERTLQGETSAFGGLVDRHIQQVAGFLRYFRAPEAAVDDLVQETFVKAFRNLKQFDRQRSFFKWTLAIARNSLFDEKRRFHRELEKMKQLSDLPPEQETSLEQQVIHRQTTQEILASLNERDRFLVEARAFKDLSFQEIAELTGDRVDTLMVRFHRIVKRLRKNQGGEHP